MRCICMFYVHYVTMSICQWHKYLKDTKIWCEQTRYAYICTYLCPLKKSKSDKLTQMVRIGLGLGWLDLDCREAVMSSQFASFNFQSKGSAGLTESQVFDIIWVPRGLTAAWAKQMCSTKTVNCQLPDVQNDIFCKFLFPRTQMPHGSKKIKS